MSFPPEHLRHMYQFERDRFGNPIPEQPSNTTGMGGVTPMRNQLDQVRMMNPIMMSAQTLALVESMRNMFQTGLVGNSQLNILMPPRGPPPLYNRPRSKTGKQGQPRGPPPLMNSLSRAPPPAHQNSNRASFIPEAQVHNTSSRPPQPSVQFHPSPQTAPHTNQPPMPHQINHPSPYLVRQPPPAHMTQAQFRPQVSTMANSSNTIRITNPFDTDHSIPTALPPLTSYQPNRNHPPQVLPTSSQYGLSSSSNSMTNSDLFTAYQNPEMRHMLRSSLFPQHFAPASFHPPHTSAENSTVLSTLLRKPGPVQNPYSDFNVLPKPNQQRKVTSAPSSKCQENANDDVSDINVMGRWYKVPSDDDKELSDEVEEKTKSLDKNTTFGTFVNSVVKKEIIDQSDRIHRPSKQPSSHSGLENVVNKLFRQQSVSPINDVASELHCSRESLTTTLSSEQDNMPDTEVNAGNSQLSSNGSEVMGPVIDQLSSNESDVMGPVIDQLSSNESDVMGPVINPVENNENHVDPSSDIGLCILNTYSLAFKQNENTDNESTTKMSEDSANKVRSKHWKEKRNSLSPKKVPPLKIKLPFNRTSSKKKGFGSPKRTYGSPVKSAYHHFAKNAKKLIEIRKPKALSFDSEKDKKENINEEAPKSNMNVSEKGEVSKNTEVPKSLDEVVAKVKQHKKCRRSTVLLDSTGSTSNITEPPKKNIVEVTTKEQDGIRKNSKPENSPQSVNDNIGINSDQPDIPTRLNLDSTLCNEKNAGISNSNEDNIDKLDDKQEVPDEKTENPKTLSKEERNRELIEKNWVQIEARLKMVEKKFKEAKQKSPVKKQNTDSSVNVENKDQQREESGSPPGKSSVKDKVEQAISKREENSSLNKKASKSKSSEKSTSKSLSSEKTNLKDRDNENLKSAHKTIEKSASKSPTAEIIKSSKDKSLSKNSTSKSTHKPDKNRKSKQLLTEKLSSSSSKHDISPKPSEISKDGRKTKDLNRSLSPKSSSEDSKSPSSFKESNKKSKHNKCSENISKEKSTSDESHANDRVLPLLEKDAAKTGMTSSASEKQPSFKTPDQSQSPKSGKGKRERITSDEDNSSIPYKKQKLDNSGEKESNINAEKQTESSMSDNIIPIVETESNSVGSNGTIDDAAQTIFKITYPTFFVSFHGKRVLCLNSSMGKLLLMREILRKNFKHLVVGLNNEWRFKKIYIAKERDLKIGYKEIPEEHKAIAIKYLLAEKLLKDNKKEHLRLGVISLENALRLYHYMNGLKACSEQCIELWAPKPEESTDVIVGSSENNVDNEGYESDVTIPYTDEMEKEDDDNNKKINENSNKTITGDNNKDEPENNEEEDEDSRLVLRGGVAECYGSYFRYIVVEGEKFYPYEDLVLKFGKNALTNALQSRLPQKFRAYKCTEVEADFFNKLEETLPTLAIEATLLEEELFNKVACTAEFLQSNKVVDLTDDIAPMETTSEGDNENQETRHDISGLEVDLTEEEDGIDLSQDDSIIELSFDSPESPLNDAEMTDNTVSQEQSMCSAEQSTCNATTITNETHLQMEQDCESKMDEEIPLSEQSKSENIKAPCDSTSNIGTLEEVSSQLSTDLEENNNNKNEPTSLTETGKINMADQFRSMLSDLEKGFNVSSGNDTTTEKEISQISVMHKKIEEAINAMATEITPGNSGNDMNIQQAVKICFDSFKESNKDISDKFMRILQQGVVYRAKFCTLKKQLTEFRSGTDNILSSCNKYEDMLSKLIQHKGDG